MLVPRRVRKLREADESLRDDASYSLSDFRKQGAWVLLGEPGAGKSCALAEEANASGGVFLTIAEFLIDDPDEEWRGKTLFLDGLDESRAGGSGENILLQTRSRLKKLGSPPFRIACRAADWFGSSDSATLATATMDGEIAVLLLEPLCEKDILDILRDNYAVSSPEAFVAQARKHGVADLLTNPQTLGLLAQAIRGDQWPDTRQKTFELACQKLAAEANKTHRDKQRNQPLPVEQLLDAAGQLCAALLLSDKTGIALDVENESVGRASARHVGLKPDLQLATNREVISDSFPLLDHFSPPDLELAQGAVRSKLFKQSSTGVERLIPSHRSIAEFLAARWLAQQIDSKGLPLGRVLNLVFGTDERTVAGLRGLYGWLALHCQAARTRLIEADPLTVVIYGDVKPMPANDKRAILAGLRREAKRYSAFRWEIPTVGPLGALANPELQADFIAALDSPERDAASQAFADCVLDILVEGDHLPGLAATAKNVALDDTRWSRVRTNALQAWLRLGVNSDEALAVLDAINDGRIADADDEMAGTLLHHLYPKHMAPEALLRYLHAPKQRNYTGSYSWFWTHELPKSAPDSHFPIILDQLASRSDLPLSDINEFKLRRMSSRLIERGVTTNGEHVADDRLFRWLGIGADEYGSIQREEKERKAIADWLEAHPDRYKPLLWLCFAHCGEHENPPWCLNIFERRLHNAAAPADIGTWHLEQASLTSSDVLAPLHLSRAFDTLIRQQGNDGLSLEKIENWAAVSPERQAWLEPLLAWEIPDWKKDEAARRKIREQRWSTIRQERSALLKWQMDAIRTGTANPALMHELSAVWLDFFADVHGDTPLERFESYCENGSDLLAATESGLCRYAERTDLPTVPEIVDLNIQQQEHIVRLPCLVGMELRWKESSAAVDALSDDALRRMIAFRLTYGADRTPDWFTHLVRERPALVARVLIDYASATFKSKRDHVDTISLLQYDSDYRELARAAVPILLESFPLRAASGKLPYLDSLLKAALRYSLEQLPAIIEKKLSTKSMEAAQKVYWLTTAMLLNSAEYEEPLWRYIGSSQSRANILTGFLSDPLKGLRDDYELSANSIGKLVELLAPHAELEWPRGGGPINEAMRRGGEISNLISRLGNLATDEAAQEIERLLAQPALVKLKFSLENSSYKLRLKQRENSFRFPALAAVAKILANREPDSAADLAALALAHLDDIARDIRQDNSDLFRHFWTEAKDNAPKPENSCRDFLLAQLKGHLSSFGIDCQPESDHFNDKRADIRLSFRNEFALPIEIKGEWNETLWTAARDQLIAQYTRDPKASDYGIYLVLWFGGERLKPAKDGGSKPRSAAELQSRLEARLDPEEKTRIFIRVLDVSWPGRL